jgi:hypothetical protein
MGKWITRALLAYLVVWLLYVALAIYSGRRAIGTPDFAPYAWRVFKQTAFWPYTIPRELSWRAWHVRK